MFFYKGFCIMDGVSGDWYLLDGGEPIGTYQTIKGAKIAASIYAKQGEI